MKKQEGNKIPEFQSLEEEKKYWEARGPLAEGRKGRINRTKVGQKRSSFLVVRLTGEELTRLRDKAATYGIGPSTFARILLTLGVNRETILPQSSGVRSPFSEEELKHYEDVKVLHKYNISVTMNGSDEVKCGRISLTTLFLNPRKPEVGSLTGNLSIEII